MMVHKSNDVNPNRSTQVFIDLPMERLKQEVLQHELIFRNQVRELHRLYCTQKNLMNELLQKGVNAHTPHSLSWGSTTGCKEPTADKNVFLVSSSTRQLGNSMARDVATLEEKKGIPTQLLRNHLVNFSPHLPTDDFLRATEEVSTGTEIVDVNDEANISYFSGEVIKKGMRPPVNGFQYKEIIDSELGCLKENEVFSCDSKAQNPEGTGVFGCPPATPSVLASSSRLFNNVPFMVHLNQEHCKRLHEQKHSCHKLLNSSFASLSDQSTMKQEARPMLIDLNMPHEDESSPDTSQDCKVAAKTMTKNQSTECRTNANVDFSSDKILISAALSEKKRQDSNISSSSSTKLPQNAAEDLERKQQHPELSEEDTISSHANANNKMKANCNPERMDKKDELSCVDVIAGQSAALSATEESITTHLNSPKDEGYYSPGKLSPGEQAITIATAAEVLMSMSIGRQSSTSRELLDVDRAGEVEGDDRSNQAQNSSDSFEHMMLQLSEVQSEEHRMSADPPRVNEIGKNVMGLSLRRGRGLRDFQKEILPGLVSLSRHEICEDLHSIGYKLKRTRYSSGKKWFVPVRSRRSRLCTGRRRH